MNYDRATIERVIQEITHQVLVTLNAQTAPSGSGCNCTDGSCVANCHEKVDRVLQAGASRVTATLGVQPRDSSVGRLIDHTLLKADATQDEIAQLSYEARK